jgi:hypothetical protein
MSTNDALNRITVAVGALTAVNVSDWSDEALRETLVQLSIGLCELDAHLARLADEVRARGFIITEVADSRADEVLAPAA